MKKARDDKRVYKNLHLYRQKIEVVKSLFFRINMH